MMPYNLKIINKNLNLEQKNALNNTSKFKLTEKPKLMCFTFSAKCRKLDKKFKQLTNYNSSIFNG